MGFLERSVQGGCFHDLRTRQWVPEPPTNLQTEKSHGSKFDVEYSRHGLRAIRGRSIRQRRRLSFSKSFHLRADAFGPSTTSAGNASPSGASWPDFLSRSASGDVQSHLIPAGPSVPLARLRAISAGSKLFERSRIPDQ